MDFAWVWFLFGLHLAFGLNLVEIECVGNPWVNTPNLIIITVCLHSGGHGALGTQAKQHRLAIRMGALAGMWAAPGAEGEQM